MTCDCTTGTCPRCHKPCHSARTIRSCRPGLGDRVASTLEAVGITKERVAAALGVEDCGCKQRQQWLNEVGYKLGIGQPDQTGNTPPPPPG